MDCGTFNMGEQRKKPVAWEDKEKELAFSWTNYEERVRHMRMLIPPETRSILDFGAGVMFLRKLLPENMSYYPVDYKRRFDETIVCDFNKKEFPEKKADAAFCSGILEYIEDLEWFAAQLTQRVETVILSYSILEAFPNIEERRETGWVNDFTTEKLIAIFMRHGFYVSEWDHVYPHQPLLKLKKITPDSLSDNYFCTGCGACVNICPHNALIMGQDEYGYYRPKLLEEKCADCGICIRSCPTLFPNYQNERQPACYAVAMKDDLRLKCSSGGIFPALAEWTLENGGAVCGAAWTKDFHVEHRLAYHASDLPALYHSKYAQSNMGTIFREIERALDQGRKVLFSACPCQVAGLYAYLKQDYENLFTIDLICTQSPSSEFFRKYLTEAYGAQRVSDYIFRTKENGWSTHYHRILFQDGTEILQGIDDDIYQQAYHPRLMMPRHCEECRFCGFPRQGDISIGDYHEIDQHDSTLNDKKGLSVLLVNNQKGRFLEGILKERALTFAETPLDWTVRHNRVRREGFDAHICRDTFYDLIRDHSFKAAAEAGLYWKRDVGIFGCWSERNYGSELTYYALYRVVRNLGYSVLLFERPMDAPWHGSGDLELFRRDPTLPGDVAGKFAKKRDMRALNERCESFMLGSDQLWPFYNSVEFGEVSYLDFIHDNKKKIAFATSFGRDRWFGDELHRAEYSHNLRRFEKISVREQSGVALCKNLFGVEADWVLDPIFLCPREDYDRLANQSSMGEGAYIGAYILDVTPEKQDALRYVSERLNLKLEIIPDAKDPKTEQWRFPVHNDACVEDFLKMFRDCRFVVTDSFHGMCMSIVFHKPFIAIMNKERGVERFLGYGEFLCLTDRIVFTPSEIWSEDNERLFSPLDYEDVDRRIAQERERSIKWLRNALSGSNEKGAMSDFDVATRKIDCLAEWTENQLAAAADGVTDLAQNLYAAARDDRMQLQRQLEEWRMESAAYKKQMLLCMKRIETELLQLRARETEFEQTLYDRQKRDRAELEDYIRILEEDLNHRIDQEE